MSSSLGRKFEIFVGATKRDLGVARQAIIDAIIDKGHIPSGMELWAAGNPPPPETIQKYLKRCDVHIMLIGASYGSIVRSVPGEISFTEWEYQQSKEKRPILAFLLSDDSLRRAREAETDRNEKRAETRGKLDRLRAELRLDHHVKEFRNDRTGIEQLKRNAILAIDELIESDRGLDNAGWVRWNNPDVQRGRALATNPFLKRELEHLGRFSTLAIRVNVDVKSKRAMAKSFWHFMHGRLRRARYSRLFFESGSTIAYLADEFGRTVSRRADADRWHIRTNNVLSLVYFDLHTPIDAARFPAGIPDPQDQYGAIFPDEWKMLEEHPPLRPRGLYRLDGEPSEDEAVRQMRESFVRENELQVALAAASGLDLDHAEEDFRGPHVGSHANMLFKRAIFTSGVPVVLFLNAPKLGNSFKMAKCYSVFGPDERWTDAIQKYPLAICVGFEPSSWSSSHEDTNALLATLSKLGFRTSYFNHEFKDGSGAVMFANAAFAQRIPID